jgi:hypothetical protein
MEGDKSTRWRSPPLTKVIGGWKQSYRTQLIISMKLAALWYSFGVMLYSQMFVSRLYFSIVPIPPSFWVVGVPSTRYPRMHGWTKLQWSREKYLAGLGQMEVHFRGSYRRIASTHPGDLCARPLFRLRFSSLPPSLVCLLTVVMSSDIFTKRNTIR